MHTTLPLQECQGIKDTQCYDYHLIGEPTEWKNFSSLFLCAFTDLSSHMSMFAMFAIRSYTALTPLHLLITQTPPPCAGSHGAGEASETETPLVVWGRGVSRPQDPASFQASRMMFDPRVSSDWSLSHVRRHDVHQADIAPLMAALINIPIPVNNVVCRILTWVNPLMPTFKTKN